MSQAITIAGNLSVGSFDTYISTVNRATKLSSEQERELAIRFRDHGDLAAARELVLANLRFVVHVARGYAGYGLPLNDIVQEGNVGLMKAVKRFDPNVGVRLVSFAVHWIRAEIHEYVIKNWRVVKVATTKAQRKLFFNLRKSKKSLAWLNHEEAKAIANDLDVNLKTVYEMEKRLTSHDITFDAPPDSQDEKVVAAPANFLQQSDADPALLLENADWQDHGQGQLTDALATLDERSRDIVTTRWLNENKMTLHDLADRYSVSAERIRQLEKNAMKKLKAVLMLEL